MGYLRARFGSPVGVIGFSMGGGIALTLAGRTQLDGVFAINPVCNISELVWTSPLFSTVRRDLEEQGITLEDVRATFAGFEPLEGTGAPTEVVRIRLGRSLYDQINDPANYDLLIARRGIINVMTYKAGHLNVLRVPKLAADVLRFCRTSMRNELL
jgi:pimeloyl-ACP methyl ester carboxylesterase